MRIAFLSTAYHTSHILKERFKTEWKLFSTGIEIMRAFETNRIDLAYVGLTPVIYAKNRGLNLVCVAGGHVEGTVIAGRAEGEFPECLEGKRVGTLAKGTMHDVVLRSVKANFEVVNYPYAEMLLNDFIDQHVDFVCGTPNLAVLAEKYGAKIVCKPAELWSWNPSYGIIVKRDFYEENVELLADFLIKHEWACNLLREARDFAVQKIYRSFKGELKLDEIRKIVELSPKYCSSLPEKYIESTLKLAKFMKELGYIERIPKRSEIFELSLINEIHPQKEHYSQ
ncbi:MAG: ABC transporter substrate-binding protein [Archaeoglobaceae archaeon]